MFFRLTFVASMAAAVLAAPSFYLVGDSTMASHSASEGIQGWGVKIPAYLENITVVNKAVSGRSARSYWREGKWAAVQASLVSGDYVIIEFGHNDGGSPSTSDRASVVGEGTATETVTLSDGTVETVYTWPTYVGWMIDGAKSKGATPIISAQTPNNPYENSDTIVNSPPRFVGYAKNIATSKGVPYVDHFAATISLYTKLGKTVTESYFPLDHTHTNDAGADQVAWAFLSGLKCTAAAGVLSQYVNSVGQGAGARC
ncbi:GDSL-like lipase/acylhydrolase [Rhizoctonia solani AG-3 Rhs1AP]|uniref:GDSL-like lipase/acylhydrolase n=2 Tax=Rhizoctonia solani AG-3 TaxID=1086053 RepID=A0A074RXB2_9AGAM|nr:GDSL-like lipase/acylhydrolase [Rhizoctonia solani AG-3 Rhs1AP]KEP49233.1 GDSL-like lipase/acylhydrolase [Rhizoctonia solani 123E]